MGNIYILQIITGQMLFINLQVFFNFFWLQAQEIVFYTIIGVRLERALTQQDKCWLLASVGSTSVHLWPQLSQCVCIFGTNWPLSRDFWPTQRHTACQSNKKRNRKRQRKLLEPITVVSMISLHFFATALSPGPFATFLSSLEETILFTIIVWSLIKKNQQMGFL